MGEFISNNFNKLRNEIIEIINNINIVKIGIAIALAIIFYLFLFFLIKILARKFKDLQIIKRNLNKVVFYFIAIIFLSQIPGGLSNFLESLFLFFLMLQALKILDYIIVDIIYIKRTKKEPSKIFRDIIKAVLWIIIFLMMLKSIFGFSIQDIAITSAVVTAALAFSFQDTMVNIISGISLSSEKLVKIGDFIQLKTGEMGTVIQTSWRSTRIRNKKNLVVIVPNKAIATAEIINHTYYKQTGRLFTVHASLFDDPIHVKNIILEYLKSVEQVLDYPHPNVFLKEYKDSLIFGDGVYNPIFDGMSYTLCIPNVF